MPSSKKLAVKPLSWCCTASFVGYSSEFGMPKMSLCATTSDIGERSMLPESLAVELFAPHFVPCHGNLLCRFWTTDTISSHPSSNTWTIWLWISARRTFLVLKNHITDCTSEEVGFSIFVLVSNEGQIVTLHYARTVFSLDYRHSKCTRHLRGRYSPSVLTFWLCLLV